MYAYHTQLYDSLSPDTPSEQIYLLDPNDYLEDNTKTNQGQRQQNTFSDIGGLGTSYQNDEDEAVDDDGDDAFFD